jgi:ElaB/YqjD/DUF883 family membrane-anchored ribosome-binding protein
MEQQQQSLGEKTRRVTTQAQQKVGEEVKTGLDTGKKRAAGALHDVAESLLHGSGDQADGVSRYIQQAGEQVRRVADWLEQSDVEELTHRTEDFARRQPALFIGGAFALGLVAARFIKSSSREQQEKRFQQQRYTGQPTGQTFGAGAQPLGTDSAWTPAPLADMRTTGYGDAASRTGEQPFRDGGV